MSVFDEDVVTRVQLVRERLAALRAHQTEERKRLHAIVVQDLLDSGLSLREASRLLELSPTYVQREAHRDTSPAEDPEFQEIDEAIERYVLG